MAYNQLNRSGTLVGGWAYGSSGCPGCQIQAGSNQTMTLLQNQSLTVNEDGQVQCSVAGLFWSVAAPAYVVEEATTKSKKTGGSGGAWHVLDWCSPKSTPPDWNPTIAASQYDWPYYISVSVCSRPANAAKGTAWNCQPNPSPVSAGSVDPSRPDCTNYDAGTSGPPFP